MSRELTGRIRLREAVLLGIALSGAALLTPAHRPDVNFADLFGALGQKTLPVPASVAPSPAPALSAVDAAYYHHIFVLQDAGDWQAAAALLPHLSDSRLAGVALARRYLKDAAYHASFLELADWLRRYHDQPDAPAIYRLAVARAPDGALLAAPNRADGVTGYLDVFADPATSYVSSRDRPPAEQQAIDALEKQIRDAVSRDLGSQAANLLSYTAAARHLDPVEYDQQRALIASAFFYGGRPKTALNLAGASADRSGGQAPLAGWIGGLAAWRLGHYARAADLFEQTATSPYASSWMAAGGAYWAYRAHARADDGQAKFWLERAAAQPRTFYGLIALRTLGKTADFHWDMPSVTPAHLARLAALPAGSRALALAAAGQPRLAERELAQINPGNDTLLAQALLAYAEANEMPALAMRIAEAVPHPGGGLYDAALYPVSPWTPAGGYRLDRALVHAIVRQESRFDPAAQSQSGAIGLMQLMPGTASDVNDTGDDTALALDDPAINLDLGQRYIAGLLGQSSGGDLISTIAAYNAGPGNLHHWKDQMDGIDDPLLFLESIPVTQTRTFTEHVMTNYWIYAARLGQPAPSLSAVAAGHWAQYAATVQPADIRVASATLH